MEKNGTKARMVDTLPSDIAAFRKSSAQDVPFEQKMITPEILQQSQRLEIFTFSAPETGDIVFNVRGIKDALADRKLPFAIYEVDLTEDWINHIENNNGVEQEKIAKVDDTRINDPGILLLWPWGDSTVIDGNHRMVARWRRGLRIFRFACIHVALPLLPFMCKPGDEEQFLPDIGPNYISIGRSIRKE